MGLYQDQMAAYLKLAGQIVACSASIRGAFSKIDSQGRSLCRFAFIWTLHTHLRWIN